VTSSENLDLVRSIYADWERGDFNSAEWADPEIEFVYVGGPSPGTFRGLAGMTEGHGGWLNAWDDFRVVADEYRELDEERVLVLDQPCGRGKSSGLDIGQKGATLFHIRDGRVMKLVITWDHAPALADLGLTPETGRWPR
jgi:ketosteroid isomerase-like protein